MVWYMTRIINQRNLSPIDRSAAAAFVEMPRDRVPLSVQSIPVSLSPDIPRFL